MENLKNKISSGVREKVFWGAHARAYSVIYDHIWKQVRKHLRDRVEVQVWRQVRNLVKQ